MICDDFVLPPEDGPARFWVRGGGQGGERSIEGCVQEVRMIERFVELVRTGAGESYWPQIAVDTMRVCDAVLASAEAGSAVRLQELGD